MSLVKNSLSLPLRLASDVKSGLDSGAAVVALESTVVSHGLPYPKNLETIRLMADAVRDEGGMPAVIAFFEGEARVGLADEELEQLASDDFRKLSVRDLPIAVAKKLNGATTVATTSLVAHAAGIQVFATGGIGGVHRGHSHDVSADLPVLASTPICVVCSGAKAILDLEATREWLETNGVTLLGYGTTELPAFYSRSSGLFVDEHVSTAFEASKIIAVRDSLRSEKAVIVAVPVPHDDEVPAEQVESWIGDALAESEAKGISGKELTPFLLSRLSDLSGGATLRANISLLISNARIAARIAKELSS